MFRIFVLMENNLNSENEKNNFDMFVKAMQNMANIYNKVLLHELKQRPFQYPKDYGNSNIGRVCVN